MADLQFEIRNPSYATPPDGGGLKKAAFPSLAEGATVRLAFLNNNKPNTGELLELIGAGLGARYKVEARLFFKDDAAHPAPTQVLEDISRYADVAVLATAD